MCKTVDARLGLRDRRGDNQLKVTRFLFLHGAAVCGCQEVGVSWLEALSKATLWGMKLVQVISCVFVEQPQAAGSAPRRLPGAVIFRDADAPSLPWLGFGAPVEDISCRAPKQLLDKVLPLSFFRATVAGGLTPTVTPELAFDGAAVVSGACVVRGGRVHAQYKRYLAASFFSTMSCKGRGGPKREAKRPQGANLEPPTHRPQHSSTVLSRLVHPPPFRYLPLQLVTVLEWGTPGRILYQNLRSEAYYGCLMGRPGLIAPANGGGVGGGCSGSGRAVLLGDTLLRCLLTPGGPEGEGEDMLEQLLDTVVAGQVRRAGGGLGGGRVVLGRGNLHPEGNPFTSRVKGPHAARVP